VGVSLDKAELPRGLRRHSAGYTQHAVYRPRNARVGAAAGRGRCDISHGIREQPPHRRRYRIRRRDALGHSEHHLRPCRHAVFLQFPRLPDIFAGRRYDACHHEPADRYAHDSGKPQNRSAEPARGRVRPRSRQVARYPHRRFPRLRGRHNYRLHPRRRPHSGRIGSAAVHRGLCAQYL